MAESPSPKKARLRREDTENPMGASSAVVATQSEITMTAPTQEVRDELTQLMQDLLLKTHELSFEYSTMECEDISECPLAKKSKELFRVVKLLNEMVKKMAKTPQAG
jgi:uncharacterized linocin/CFP29 family protein